MKHYIEGFNAGGSRRAITKGHIENFLIAFPPLDEQREIAAMLGVLDDKIELNRRMNGTLEGMARALFRSWFVDFDPVHAKAAGEAPAHMDEATAALFPARFNDNGLPEGWTRTAARHHVRVAKGLSYKGAGLTDSEAGVPLHNLNSIFEGGGYKDEGIKYYASEYRERHTISPGDLIVANTEQGFDELLIGHAALIPRNFGQLNLFSHHTYKLEPLASSPLTKEWWYLALSCSPIGVAIRGFANGTTVNMLPADAFELPLIVTPSQPLVAEMTKRVLPLFALQEANREQSRTLAALRDTLLPKLMSGEVRVREAEKRVAEVV